MGGGYEDFKPFYWTDAELADPAIGGNPNPFRPPTTLKFSDTSQRGFTDAASKPISWTTDLYLVCTWDSMIHPLGYYEWGWTMPMGMANNQNLAITLTPGTPVFMPGYKADLKGIVESNTEFGAGSYPATHGGNARTITNQCCRVPLPQAFSAGLVGLGAVGPMRAARRRLAARADSSSRSAP